MRQKDLRALGPLVCSFAFDEKSGKSDSINFDEELLDGSLPSDHEESRIDNLEDMLLDQPAPSKQVDA